ncbi:MAG: sulfite exporter TauE/SafE family protein [Eggerthellaceae bacterium]|nr:sulfite exporter TauE/SafE family protein [Eggerthellaceae bacterium]
MFLVVAAVLCGVVIGTLSGILGVGGGSMMVPLFRLGFGMSALAATGTSMFAMIFTSIGGSVSHVRNKTCIVPLALVAGGCGALTSPIGVWLASRSPAWMVMTAAALVVAYSAATMIRKGLAVPKTSALGEGEGSTQPIKTPRLSRRQYLLGAVAGIAAGVAGGYVGLGGGFLMVPIFLSGVGITMKHASGTSLFAVAIIAASAAFTQGALGNVDVAIGLAVAAGSIPAAMLSANLVKRIPERSLRLGFGLFLLVVAVLLAVNEFVVGG